MLTGLAHLCQGRGWESLAAPAAVMLTTPKIPLIARLGRSGKDDAKPEDLPVSQYQQLRWEVGCPEAPG